MRFSVVCGPRQRADLGESAADAWRNFVGDGVLADQLGFDAFSVGEHHFCFASGNSAPLAMLANLAAKTERIRLGTTVICAPFHNPLTLAENVAAVDIASNGRFELGIGVGSQWEEFQTFGVDPKERFGRTWEVIDIVERCLHGEDPDFDWQGKYFSFPGVRWIMPPVQKRIPIFWGGFGPQGVRRAAERGYHLIAPDVTGVYQAVMAEHGRDPKDHLIGFANPLSIAPTREAAFEAVAEPCMWVCNQYALRKDLDGVQPPDSARVTMDDMRRAWDTGAQVGFANPAGGTVEDAIARLLPIVRGEHGLITNLVLEFRQPGVATENAHRSMRLFAEEVMPVLKAEAAKAGR